MNACASRLFASFVDVAIAPSDILQNVLLATLDPCGLRPSIVNFEEVASLSLDRARRESVRMPDDPSIAKIRADVATIEDLPAPRSTVKGAVGPFIGVHLRRGDLEARLFTTIATIGTPIDATAQDIRIETFFPADEATRALFRSWV